MVNLVLWLSEDGNGSNGMVHIIGYYPNDELDKSNIFIHLWSYFGFTALTGWINKYRPNRRRRVNLHGINNL